VKTIEFDVLWNDNRSNKIPAIKQLRNATKCGLKEAKDAVESVDGCYRRWRMTAEQFGIFVVEHWNDEATIHFYVRDVTIVPVVTVALDFATM